LNLKGALAFLKGTSVSTLLPVVHKSYGSVAKELHTLILRLETRTEEVEDDLERR
jgi:hypothetical protein